jgi:hypothetical protein
MNLTFANRRNGSPFIARPQDWMSAPRITTYRLIQPIEQITKRRRMLRLRIPGRELLKGAKNEIRNFIDGTLICKF